MKLSRKEQEIERALLAKEYIPVSEKEFLAIAQAIARRRKQAIISLRLNQDDLDSLKRKAKQLNVPYQSLISEILHRFAA